ncbi:MAG TPA: YjbF family lipoprotein [Rhodanobacteraceae bacterium]
MGGCSNVASATRGTLGLLIHGTNSHVVPTPAGVAAIPYAQLQVTSKDGSAVLVLGNVDHGREAWYSADKEIVFLRDGVLVKTWHLRPDIVSTHFPPDSPFLTGLQHLRAAVTTTRTLDLPDYRYGVEATSHLVPAGMHDVVILGRTHHLLRIDETLVAPAIHFRADNVYWVDPTTGLVWKSRQSIPGGLILTLTQLKPYRGGRS